MDKAVRSYVDEAVQFRPRGDRPLRVAATLLTCRTAAAVLNEMGLREDTPSAYRWVNVFNPAQQLQFDINTGHWWHLPAAEDHPAWGINWHGAVLLCRRMGARLPTEREWNCFAANNDADRPYPWGHQAPDFHLANYDEHFGGTTRVRSFPPSDLGLYDLAGNLSEWCQDAFGHATSLERVAKGGAWSKDDQYLAIAASRGKWARLGTTTIGIRPVWDDR